MKILPITAHPVNRPSSWAKVLCDGLTAINNHLLTGHESTGIACQEDGSTGNFIRHADTAQRRGRG